MKHLTVFALFAVLALVSKTNLGIADDSKTDRLIGFELKAQELISKLDFLAPSLNFSAATENNFEHSSSSFIVLHNKRQFLLTASHSISAINESSSRFPNAMKVNGDFVILPNNAKRTFMTSLDLAAVEVTGIIPRSLGGVLKSDKSVLVAEKTPLILFCNPLTFSTHYLGFYDKGSRTNYLTISFPGDGVKAGCSGSPVIDMNGFVRGLLVRASVESGGIISGEEGYAVPAKNIIKFLDAGFFRK